MKGIEAVREEAAQVIGLLTATCSDGVVLDKVADFFDDMFQQLEAAQRAEGDAKTRIAELERQWEFRSPTPEAYEAACKALEKHRQRADAAESELKRRGEQKPVATLDIQRGRPDGNKYALVYSSAGHALPDDVYTLYAAAPAAVPGKVVKLPIVRNRFGPKGSIYLNEMIAELDAAGVKWVEGE